MKTLELLRNYNTEPVSHRDVPNVQYLTSVSLNMLHFTFSMKEPTEVVDYFLNELGKLDPGRDYSAWNAFRIAFKYRDNKRFTIWGRRLLESFRFLYAFLANIPLKSERIRFFHEYFSSIEYCLQLTLSLVKEKQVDTKDIICDIGKFLRLYRDYAILPAETLGSAYLKNLIFQITNKREADDSIEFFPGMSIDVCRIQPSQLHTENQLDAEGLALLIDKANTYLDKADSLAGVAREATSFTEYLLTILPCHFFYQIALLMLQHVVSESEGRGLVVPQDVYREVKIAEENRAELAQIFDTDCGALLIGPICAPCAEVGKIQYSQAVGEPLPHAGYVDVGKYIRNGILRDPVYPSVLNHEWPAVLKSLDITRPINFSGTNISAFRNLSDELLIGISKQFVNAFVDSSVAKTVVWQQHTWQTAPLSIIDMMLLHEGQHIRQYRYFHE